MYSLKKEQLTKLILKCSTLTDLYAMGAMNFSDKTCEWLKEVEDCMARLRLPSGAKMATLRAKVTGGVDLALKNGDIRVRSEARKYQNAITAEALEEAQITIQNVIDEANETLTFYEKKLEEAMTAAILQNKIPITPKENREEWLKSILFALKEYQPTKPTLIYMEVSLMLVDRLYIVDNIMTKVLSRKSS